MCPARPRILLILQQLHSHCYCITAADRKRCGCRAQEDTVSTNTSTSTKTGKSRLGNCQGWAGLGWAGLGCSKTLLISSSCRHWPRCGLAGDIWAKLRWREPRCTVSQSTVACTVRSVGNTLTLPPVHRCCVLDI